MKGSALAVGCGRSVRSISEPEARRSSEEAAGARGGDNDYDDNSVRHNHTPSATTRTRAQRR